MSATRRSACRARVASWTGKSPDTHDLFADILPKTSLSRGCYAENGPVEFKLYAYRAWRDVVAGCLWCSATTSDARWQPCSATDRPVRRRLAPPGHVTSTCRSATNHQLRLGRWRHLRSSRRRGRQDAAAVTSRSTAPRRRQLVPRPATRGNLFPVWATRRFSLAYFYGGVRQLNIGVYRERVRHKSCTADGVINHITNCGSELISSCKSSSWHAWTSCFHADALGQKRTIAGLSLAYSITKIITDIQQDNRTN